MQNVDSDLELIRLAAYAKWQAAGSPAGDGVEFWLEAENEYLVSLKLQPATEAIRKPQILLPQPAATPRIANAASETKPGKKTPVAEEQPAPETKVPRPRGILSGRKSIRNRRPAG